MKSEFHVGNRARLWASLPNRSLAVLFAGEEIRKSVDACYPFYADRNFLYLTGIRQKQSILLAVKNAEGAVSETLYLLPKDAMAERWTGRRLTPEEAQALSGVDSIKDLSLFSQDFHTLAQSGGYASLWLDLYRNSPQDPPRPGHRFAQSTEKDYPQLALSDLSPLVKRLRLIKQPCEIEAFRKAEEITGAGILAMMRASHPGMYEYQYKAEFDRTLGQYGPQEPGFASIISAGANNFCIHYDSYTGIAKDGDMILNDVGARWEDVTVDVSRSWPCNGKFSQRQKLLYECALKTSDYMFSIIRPGMKMADVDGTIRRYCAQLLVDAGVLDKVENAAKYMWHGGAHHIGFDCHDLVERPETIAPGMVFCVDVGIYHEEWGIGFRLEDNCLVTETGCENLSAAIPRTVEAIESYMAENRQ